MEYMCANKEGEEGMVKMKGAELKSVDEFKFLGLTVQGDGGSRSARTQQNTWQNIF